MARIITKTSTGGVGPIAASATPFRYNLPIVSASIDTKGLESTDISLKFTTTINFPDGVTAILLFTIVKYEAKSCEQVIGNSYVYSTLTNADSAESFIFVFTDKDVNPGKYTYSIQLATGSLVSGESGGTLTNSTLSIYAIGEEEDKKGSSSSSSSSSSSASSSSASANSSEASAQSEGAAQSEGSENAVETSEVKEDKKDDKKEEKADNKKEEKKDDKKEDKKK